MVMLSNNKRKHQKLISDPYELVILSLMETLNNDLIIVGRSHFVNEIYIYYNMFLGLNLRQFFIYNFEKNVSNFVKIDELFILVSKCFL